jgi:hypothetical protein
MSKPGQLEIINTALSVIGHTPTDSLTTQSGNAARLIYNWVVRHFLSINEWRFAIRQFDVSGSGVATSDSSMAPSWEYEYSMPPECLRLLGFVNFMQFESYGNKVFANTEPGQMDYAIYVREVTEEFFAPYFVGALIQQLAGEYAGSIARNTSEATARKLEAEKMWRIAMHRDSQTTYNASLEPVIEVLLARDNAPRP